MGKLLKGENVKDVLPGQKSNIPLKQGETKKPAKVDKAPSERVKELKDEVKDAKTKAEDATKGSKVKELAKKIEDKKELINDLKNKISSEKTVSTKNINSDANKLDKHPASKSVHSMSNEKMEATVTIAPEIIEA